MKHLYRHWIPAFAGMTKKHILTGIVLITAIIFSSWLMFHTFSYNGTTHEIRIAFKLWSDFGAHIPLIRSFSMGDNLSRMSHELMPQYPIFPGAPIRYHFMFYMVVGILEKLGLRIDWALNLPSIAGFTLLLCMIYFIAKKLFGSISVAVLSVVFFLFNGSLGFLQFLKEHPLSKSTISQIIHIRDFPAFAPWKSGDVSAFWNLNIFTNQRHLALSFGIIAAFVFTYLRPKPYRTKQQVWMGCLWGILFGMFPYFHQPSLLIIAVILLWYFMAFPKDRIFTLSVGITSAALIIPQILLLTPTSKVVSWYPGYIIHNDIIIMPVLQAILRMVVFWWNNLGLHSILIITGFFLIPKKARLLLFPIVPLFFIGTLFKFSVEASANHKLFNFVMIFGQMISAYVIVSSFRTVYRHFRHWMARCLLLIVYCFVFIVLTCSGILDFFVVVNDTRGSLKDVPSNEISLWIATNTPKSAIFLNTRYLYDPASMAGRSIFLGWPYFAWSAGYEENRMPIMDVMYETGTPAERCDLLHKYNISYVEVEDVRNDENLPNISLFSFLKGYTPVYLSSNKTYALFTTDALCAHP